jgi:hypothetical protein
MYKALPIKVDFEESENVYNSIFFLFSTNHKIVRLLRCAYADDDDLWR